MAGPLTAAELVRHEAEALAAAGVESPRLAAQVLVAHAMGLDRDRLLADPRRPVAQEQAAAASALCARHARGEPAAQLTGEREFFGLAMAVTPDVLIPRPESEHLVEEALARFGPDRPLAFADLGTGSGALAAALAAHRPRALGWALDRSAAALDVARANLARHGVGERVRCLRADFGALPVAPGSLDLVLANPPYVSRAEHAELAPGVRDFEPASALVPHPVGETGLESAAALLPQARRALRPGGWLLMELGWTQGPAVLELLAAARPGWSEARVLPDLAGRDRVAAARV